MKNLFLPWIFFNICCQSFQISCTCSIRTFKLIINLQRFDSIQLWKFSKFPRNENLFFTPKILEYLLSKFLNRLYLFNLFFTVPHKLIPIWFNLSMIFSRFPPFFFKSPIFNHKIILYLLSTFLDQLYIFNPFILDQREMTPIYFMLLLTFSRCQRFFNENADFNPQKPIFRIF